MKSEKRCECGRRADKPIAGRQWICSVCWNLEREYYAERRKVKRFDAQNNVYES